MARSHQLSLLFGLLRQIPEFKASLVQNKFHVEKSLNSGMIVCVFNSSIQETEPFRSLNSRSIYKASSRTAKLRQ